MTYQINISLTVTFTEEQRRVCECGPSKCDAEVEVERIKRHHKQALTYCKVRKEGRRGYVVRYGLLVTRTEPIWGRPGFGFAPGASVKIYRSREKKPTPKPTQPPAFKAEQFTMFGTTGL